MTGTDAECWVLVTRLASGNGEGYYAVKVSDQFQFLSFCRNCCSDSLNIIYLTGIAQSV
jgi:hypothetical protein